MEDFPRTFTGSWRINRNWSVKKKERAWQVEGRAEAIAYSGGEAGGNCVKF